jgi:hypothetical protein
MPTIPATELTHFCEAILQAAGVPRHNSAPRWPHLAGGLSFWHFSS